MLANLISKRLGVVVATIAVAILPTFTEKFTEAIDWRIYALVGGYIIAQTAKDIVIALIQARAGIKTPAPAESEKAA